MIFVDIDSYLVIWFIWLSGYLMILVNRLFGYLMSNVRCRVSGVGCRMLDVRCHFERPDFRRGRRNLILISDFQFFRGATSIHSHFPLSTHSHFPLKIHTFH